MGQKIIVGFDIETPDADSLYLGEYEGDFLRLLGAIRDGKTMVSSDHVKEFLDLLNRADRIYGHNIFRFDLPALARHAGADYDALAAKAIDTAVLARLIDPPGAKHATAPGYYGLDQVAHRTGHSGKSGNLKAMAKDHGGYDKIPVTDSKYREYLRGDLEASEHVYNRLRWLRMDPSESSPSNARIAYAEREMKVAAFQNRMSLNGWKINRPLLGRRVRQEDERRQGAIAILGDDYGVPLVKADGKPSLSPWATKAGRLALEAAFKDAGAEYVPRTETGALAIGKKPMGEGWWVTHDGRRVPGMLNPDTYGGIPAVRELCGILADATGATAKYAEISRYVTPEGRVHGGIGEDQASGRWAMTKPSLTNLGKRGEGVQQRAPFIPEPGHVLIACDASQVDMRALAALSQDTAYMKLFVPGRDAHMDMAEVYFGERTKEARDKTKAINHGLNYGQSARAVAARTGLPILLVLEAVNERSLAYPRVMEWTEEVREIGASGQLLDNGFGRMMRCDPSRAHTQAPALMGQGAARDLICRALLRLVSRWPEVTAYLRGVVHDEVIVSVPEAEAHRWQARLEEAFTFEWQGVPILCEVSQPGSDWAECYTGE